MKKIYNYWLDKVPIFKYISSSFIKWFRNFALLFSFAYIVLSVTGCYVELENCLDLKYNSPCILVLLYGAIILAVIAFVVGAILYFFKYRRIKSKTKFYQAVSVVFDTNKRGGKR